MTSGGDFIGGQFVSGGENHVTSRNPAKNNEVVAKTSYSTERCSHAVAAAQEAAREWMHFSHARRVAVLETLKVELEKRRQPISETLTAETGKVLSETNQEVSALVGRFALAASQVEFELRSAASRAQVPGERLAFRPHGVVAIIGPFNFPLHLCHAYVLPSLLMGNAVVVKPSEVAIGSAHLYAQAIQASQVPDGLINIVHGPGEVGAAILAERAVRGVYFTGSYDIGRRIQALELERPELLVSLEMGGKNTVVVMDDADIRQAVHECLVGGYLTTGQRCTGTDRVLVQRRVAREFVDAMVRAAKELRFGDPTAPGIFAGPLTTKAGTEKFDALLETAVAGGAQVALEGQHFDGGNYRTASLHVLPDGTDSITGYTDVECFGPDLAVQIVEDEMHAAAVVHESPYGFANAVFTRTPARLERFYEHTYSGILNCNRSTNLASPRLPFGGVGRSGNHRPGGAYSPRHAVTPMARLENPAGPVTVHPAISQETLPKPDLEQLSIQHEQEEGRPAPSLLEHPRPMKKVLPTGGKLPQSEAWLERLYAAGRVAREKKPQVVDHWRSGGPWLVSVDDSPMSVLDAMSQTATLCGGFSEDSVVRSYFEGDFDGTLGQGWDPTQGGHEVLELLADTLRQAVGGHPHVTFANSGSEANEKALSLCYEHREDTAAGKILAFEGSFHGRTAMSLAATYNPAKREPFVFGGFDVSFAPFPVWYPQGNQQPVAPSGFYAACAQADTSLLEHYVQGDELLAQEAKALAEVCKMLEGGGFFAAIVEPMQAEGGDRYATDRFFRGLRLITRKKRVALVFDEVQTGFGLGGSFAWHESFGLIDHKGRPDRPEAVTFAKRAQLGIVMSQYEDREPTAVHLASAVRGRVHAESMGTSHSAKRIEALVGPKLAGLASAFPHLVLNPRHRGYAFAFDLPDKDSWAAYIKQRFWRGAVVYGAGSVTARYRLNDSFWSREIDELFESIRRSLAWLDAHPGQSAPEWEDQVHPQPATAALLEKVRIREATPSEAEDLLPAILDIEYQAYEPVRRTPPSQIRQVLEHKDAVLCVAEIPQSDQWEMVGFAIGAPLEIAEQVEGPDQDPMLGHSNTLYSASVTVAPEFQGKGLGRQLKRQQLELAKERLTPDGKHRYTFVSGRNRIGHTASMTHLNRVFGAHLVNVLTGQYEDPEGQAIYYRIPLTPVAPASSGRVPASSISQGIARPLRQVPDSFEQNVARGGLYGPAVNKLTLLNFATPAHIRAIEWVHALVPELPHMYLASGRDEAFDKAVRLGRYCKDEHSVIVSVADCYFGHTTASARSCSDSRLHKCTGPTLPWPRVSHPATVGEKASLDELAGVLKFNKTVAGVACELLGERSGGVLSKEYCAAMRALCDDYSVPLIFSETASSGYRGSASPFLFQDYGVTPDILLWWMGGQTAYLHVSARYWIGAPLALASTWDGDELTLIRHHHYLRALRTFDRQEVLEKVDQACADIEAAGFAVSGRELYRIIHAGDRAKQVIAQLARKGIHCHSFGNGVLPLAVAWDDTSALAALTDIIKEKLL